MKGGGHVVFEGTVPAFAWLDWEKLWNISARIVGNPDEIWTGYVPTTVLERHSYTILFCLTMR